MGEVAVVAVEGEETRGADGRSGGALLEAMGQRSLVDGRVEAVGA